MPSYLVVGAGISGLVAADDLLRADPHASVTVLEGSDRVGGKLRGAALAGRSVDVGAEAYLHRRPEVPELIRRLGAEDQVVHPTGASAQIWSRGRLHPVPPRTLMGVPADPRALGDLLTPEEVDRAAGEAEAPVPDAPAGDVSVVDLVSTRLGDAVTQRLVEPLLGGVYAARPELLSAEAALPALLAAAQRGERLTETVARMMPGATGGTQARTPSTTPVFGSLDGGMHRLPELLSASLGERGATVTTGVVVRELRAHPEGGFTLVTGPAPDPTTYRADGVVLAVPPAAAARLLAQVCPAASAELAQVETASMAVIALAFRADELGPLEGSGFLVPPVDGRTVKAATFSATKWAYVRELGRGAADDGGDLLFLRASIGRHRDEASLQVTDEDLVRTCLAELGAALGRALPEPVDAVVQRWGGGLPQYAVGHAGRVQRVRAALTSTPGVVVCGATYDGVGIPACVASAHRAAAELTAHADGPTSAPTDKEHAEA